MRFSSDKNKLRYEKMRLNVMTVEVDARNAYSKWFIELMHDVNEWCNPDLYFIPFFAKTITFRCDLIKMAD